MFTCKCCCCYTCECSSRFSWVNIFIHFGSSSAIMWYSALLYVMWYSALFYIMRYGAVLHNAVRCTVLHRAVGCTVLHRAVRCTVLHLFPCACLSVCNSCSIQFIFMPLISNIVPQQITVPVYFLIVCCEWQRHDDSWTSDVGVTPVTFIVELWQRGLKNVQLLGRFFCGL
jgi:hypothetical protein